ncbi:hypothetical protein VZ95_02090 [Elstera litoralis]|uniref:Glycosyltransferase 2-like domain-containing protein n=1 Tax=Elstera litoralis TaxID=552518 RepID=A0A0F3IZ36_9PROT|nr:glycosyltransferase family 2 protein [Elstera litoralis]KJV10864.1 hypothetical protein VZ95_02090 [Elstera litoralis]
MTNLPPASATAIRPALVLAPSARADLDDLQLLAARAYLDGLRRLKAAEPEVLLCDPDGQFPADAARRLGLDGPLRAVIVGGLPPIDPEICRPATPLMVRAMQVLEWARREAIDEVITVDLSGCGAYLALALRQGLIARPLRLTLIETGGAQAFDRHGFRYPDHADIALYHLAAEAARGASRRLCPRVTEAGAPPAFLPTRLLILLADPGLIELDWLERLLPRLAGTEALKEIIFARPGAGLTAAQKAKAVAIAARQGWASRFIASEGARPELSGPVLALIVSETGGGDLLCHLAAAWAMPFVRAVKSPSLTAAQIEAALTAPPPVLAPIWSAELTPLPAAPAPDQMSDTPRVSVCLVTFNRPALLLEAVASLEAQTAPGFEVILVDDGSTQQEALDTLDALESRFAARGWRLIRKQNGYLGAARNTAAALARGAYLLFMDDDNIAKPEMIARFLTAAETSGADILTSFNDCFYDTQRDAAGAVRPQTIMRRLFLGSAPRLGLVLEYYRRCQCPGAPPGV